MSPFARAARLIPPENLLMKRSESASAGSVARTLSGRSRSARLVIPSESTSTLKRGNVCQNVSSTRRAFTSAMRYSLAYLLTSGVSFSGVRIHTMSEMTSAMSSATVVTAAPSQMRILAHRGRRFFFFFLSGSLSGACSGGCMLVFSVNLVSFGEFFLKDKGYRFSFDGGICGERTVTWKQGCFISYLTQHFPSSRMAYNTSARTPFSSSAECVFSVASTANLT